jgi:hypothetical protein
MKNMSLIIGVAMSVCLALVFSGCESPTDGSSGSSGANGPGTFTSGVVDAAALKAVYELTDKVVVTSGVTSVDGIVPAGRTLIVVGDTKDVPVTDGETLEVAGTLEIKTGATLSASGISGTDGTLTGAGSVTGDGAVALPYYVDPEDIPEDGITYTSGNVSARKNVGSYAAANTAPATIDDTGLAAIFGLDGVDAVTVKDYTVSAASVPAGKTLTLIGTGNEFTSALDLSSKGTLVVVEGAELEAIGLLTVGDGTAATTGAVQNNGTITTASSETTPANILSYITKPTGSGTVKITGDVSTALASAAALTQNVVIASGGTLTSAAVAAPFSTTVGKTITVDEGGKLALDAAATSVGVPVVNNGSVTTATTSAAALNTLLGVLSGDITASALTDVGTGLTVPAGVNLSASGNVTAGTVLTVEGKADFSGTGATIAALTTLTVTGELTADAATFAAVTSLTVNGKLEAKAATFAALATTPTGTGIVRAGGAVPKAAVDVFIASSLGEIQLGTTAYSGALTIPAGKTIIFTASGSDSFAPDNTVTVNGTLVITGKAKLVKALTVNSGGALALFANSSGGAELTLGATDAAIAGNPGSDASTVVYEITTAASTGTLTAGLATGATDDAAVVFTAGTISGMGEDGETATAATFAFGTDDSTLTVKANMAIEALTLDVSAKGKITVTNGKTLTLTHAGDDGVLSGAIFTKAISGGTPATAVKANAATPKTTSGAISNAAALAAAKVEAKAAADVGANDLGTGATTTAPANGVITGGASTSIDTGDTFAVSGGAITPTAGT